MKGWQRNRHKKHRTISVSAKCYEKLMTAAPKQGSRHRGISAIVEAAVADIDPDRRR